MKLHVSLVVCSDGHVVFGLHVGQQLVADEEQGLMANCTFMEASKVGKNNKINCKSIID